jgi:DNA repair protein RadA
MSKEAKVVPEAEIAKLEGVGVLTASKLVQSGYDSVAKIATTSPKVLSSQADMSEPAARKLIADAREKCNIGFSDTIQFEKVRQQVTKLSTGYQELDNLLGGGFETKVITEIFGEYGSGKTQMGHLMAAKTLINPDFKNPVVFYIDSENSFRPNRVRDFLSGLEIKDEKEQDKFLKNLKVARATSTDEQMFLFEKIGKMITEQKLNVKLIVVDSLTSHFRAEFIGRGTLAERQQLLNSHMHVMMKIADLHNLAVYVTNQVMAKPDQIFGDPTESIGGHIVSHASSCRMYLRKGKKGSRVIRLVDSPDLPDGEACFRITSDGITEP